MDSSCRTKASLIQLIIFATIIDVFGQSACPANTFTCDCNDNNQDLLERVICLENAIDELIAARNQVVRGELKQTM